MSQSALLRAVRTALQATSLADRQVQVQVGGDIPATAGDVFVAIVGNTVRTGEGHAGGHVRDLIYDLDVILSIRSTAVPRDRAYEKIAAASGVFSTYWEIVDGAIEFSYSILTAANGLILTEETSSEGFIEPLRMTNRAPIRYVDSEVYGGRSGEGRAALQQTTTYGGARRIRTRT